VDELFEMSEEFFASADEFSERSRDNSSYKPSELEVVGFLLIYRIAHKGIDDGTSLLDDEVIVYEENPLLKFVSTASERIVATNLRWRLRGLHPTQRPSTHAQDR